MSLNNWFEKGLTKEAYESRLDKHKAGYFHIYETFSIPKEDLEKLKQTKQLRAVVLCGEWCGHCMMDIPIFLNIAEAAGIETRFLIRDENLSLMEQYETNGKQYVPIFIFIDDNGKELGTWGPWAPEVHEFTEDLKANLPDRDAAEFEEAFQQFVQKVSTAFKTDENLWNYVYQDMKQKILSL